MLLSYSFGLSVVPCSTQCSVGVLCVVSRPILSRIIAVLYYRYYFITPKREEGKEDRTDWTDRRVSLRRVYAALSRIIHSSFELTSLKVSSSVISGVSLCIDSPPTAASVAYVSHVRCMRFRREVCESTQSEW